MTTVYIVSFYANITKIGTRCYYCRFTQFYFYFNFQIYLTKKVMLLYKSCFNWVLQTDVFPSGVLNTIITDKIVMVKIT